jgi:hypothetical protein
MEFVFAEEHPARVEVEKTYQSEWCIMRSLTCCSREKHYLRAGYVCDRPCDGERKVLSSASEKDSARDVVQGVHHCPYQMIHINGLPWRVKGDIEAHWHAERRIPAILLDVQKDEKVCQSEI